MSTDNHLRRRVILPQEVMDMVIDALALDSTPESHFKPFSSSNTSVRSSFSADSAKQNLAHCLLVSRSFYVKARSLVFRSIVWQEQTLPCEEWNDERDQLFFDIFRVRRFHTCVDELESALSPTGRATESNGSDSDCHKVNHNDFNNRCSPLFATPLIHNVRSLRLILCFPSTARMVMFNGWSVPQSELDKRREIFPALLEQMANIDEFGLESGSLEVRRNANSNTTNTGRETLDWRTPLHQSLKDAIRRVCRTARVLQFESISYFPLSLLGACERLRSLSISSIHSVQTGSAGQWKRTTALERLEDLNMSNVSSELFLTILERRPGAFSALNRLRITLSSSSGDYVSGEQAVLRACASSLKILEVYSPTSQFTPYPPNSVSHFVSLYSLTLCSTISSLLPETFPPEMMTFFIADLVSSASGSSSSSSSSLVELTIELHLDSLKLGLKDREEIVPPEWGRRWAKVDKVLAGPAFPLLERLNIRFLECRTEKEQEEDRNNKRDSNDDGDAMEDEVQNVQKVEDHDVEMQDDWSSMEVTSLRWLHSYIEEALPKVNASSKVVIQLEYHIFG